MSKYGNVRTTVNGHAFASKKEAARYQELLLLEKAGEIEKLELQPRFPISLNGQKVCTYVADFQYRENGHRIVEDVKSEGTRTAIYLLKKRLMKAVLWIEILET